MTFSDLVLIFNLGKIKSEGAPLIHTRELSPARFARREIKSMLIGNPNPPGRSANQQGGGGWVAFVSQPWLPPMQTSPGLDLASAPETNPNTIHTFS